MWRTRWLAHTADPSEAPHPPVLIVFNRIGARDPNRTLPRLQELTRPLWAGERAADGYSSYDRKIPIIATGLRNLRARARPDRCSCASAEPRCRPCATRSATRAATRSSLASAS
ncbi:hypothetical protein AB0D54_37370 [Streptomyces xanthophaeus]|uniref:hypothetical protein n=1 Tax=Streptomyces xanthophaeus TaxID=67385 RepID=UPI00342E4100